VRVSEAARGCRGKSPDRSTLTCFSFTARHPLEAAFNDRQFFRQLEAGIRRQRQGLNADRSLRLSLEARHQTASAASWPNPSNNAGQSWDLRVANFPWDCHGCFCCFNRHVGEIAWLAQGRGCRSEWICSRSGHCPTEEDGAARQVCTWFVALCRTIGLFAEARRRGLQR
jgi:hypothetical protein